LTFLLPICGNTPKALGEAVAAFALADGRQFPDRNEGMRQRVWAPKSRVQAPMMRGIQRFGKSFRPCGRTAGKATVFPVAPAQKEEV
jgi:hypothetical protein